VTVLLLLRAVDNCCCCWVDTAIATKIPTYQLTTTTIPIKDKIYNSQLLASLSLLQYLPSNSQNNYIATTTTSQILRIYQKTTYKNSNIYWEGVAISSQQQILLH